MKPVGLALVNKYDKTYLETEEGSFEVFSRVFINNRWHRVGAKVSGSIEHTDLNIAWEHNTLEQGWLSVKATITNNGTCPQILGSFHMLEGESLGKPYLDPVVLIDSGGGWFAGCVKAKSSCPHYDEKWNLCISQEDISWAKDIMEGSLELGAHHSLSGLMAYFRETRLPTWIFSFLLPLKRCTAQPIMLFDTHSGRIKRFALINDFAGFKLDPEESIQTETILLGSFTDAHKALLTWAQTCAETSELKPCSSPPMGWTSWYGYRLTQTEEEVLRVADLINKKFSNLGFDYIQPDLGYNKANLPGEWFETNKNFRHGLKWLKDQLAERGFKFGLWLSPFVVAEDASFAREHPEALVKNSKGQVLDLGAWPWEPKCNLNMVDPTHPKGEKFLKRTIAHFKKEGATYFKLDFAVQLGSIDRDFVVSDKRKIKGIEVYRHGLKIINEVLDKSDYVYWCSNLLHAAIGLGNTNMTASDIGNTGFAGHLVEGRSEDLDYFKRQAVTVVSRYYLHNKLILLNADALNVAPPADIEECRLRATLVAMSGGQVFLGDRFDLCEKDRLEIVRQCVPPYGKAARPVDMFHNVYPESYPHIWHLAVDTGWDKRDIVAFVNLDKEKTIELDFTDIGLSTNRGYHCFQFFEKQYCGQSSGPFRIAMKAPTSRLMAIVPKRNYPWVVSTTFHYSQGAVELDQVKWDEERQILSAILNRPPGARGSIFITVPHGFKCPLKEMQAGVVELELVSKDNATPWAVKFERIRSS